MPAKEPLVDHSLYDTNNTVVGIEEIRKFNMQRHEMEQLTAVCYEDIEAKKVVAYKDLTENEFWCHGHMPGAPIMPGVIMCEAAAQLASVFSQHYQKPDGVVGFGGLDKVRFRGLVRPGDRFVIQVMMKKIRRVTMTVEFQCYVGEELVCEGNLMGVILPFEALKALKKEG